MIVTADSMEAEENVNATETVAVREMEENVTAGIAAVRVESVIRIVTGTEKEIVTARTVDESAKVAADAEMKDV